MWLDSDSCIGPVDVLVDLAAWRLDTIREALRDEEANTVTAMTHQMARPFAVVRTKDDSSCSREDGQRWQ